MRTRIIAGNWKMNGTIRETDELIAGLKPLLPANMTSQVILCPPFTSLLTASQLVAGSPIGLGAQNMSEHEKGAFTGEVSAEMLLTVGATFVILGHSERRQFYAETDKGVNVKAKRALENGLTPIICVGETLGEHERNETEAVVGRQIDGVYAGFSADDLEKTIIAYEPVWAIGTGKTATPEQAQAVHRFIRTRIRKWSEETAERISILYGGSVKDDNARALMSQRDIDGALVGGASLVVKEFIAIIMANESVEV